MKTKVIFRILQGEVIALFPELPGTNDPGTCQSYAHNGQHGSATVELGRTCRLAKPAEYRDLARELRRIGYRLDIRQRSCPAYAQTRMKAIAA